MCFFLSVLTASKFLGKRKHEALFSAEKGSLPKKMGATEKDFGGRSWFSWFGKGFCIHQRQLQWNVFRAIECNKCSPKDFLSKSGGVRFMFDGGQVRDVRNNCCVFLEPWKGLGSSVLVSETHGSIACC